MMTTHESQTGKSSNAGEYLTFTLGQENYGLEILKVREIRGYDSVTRIANTPDYIKGVINLRGTIVPILDLRIKFGLPSPAYDQFTVVVILNVAGRELGVVVDGVSDVVALTPEQVRPAPSLSPSVDTRYVTGLGALDDRMLILVDIERLIDSGALEFAEGASEERAEAGLMKIC